ncbi:MAG TPA: type II toxin-antitoxin system HicB family antitoxin [Bryobacteraceae bacterium]|nr:type II toxin-antitoxin system HicB family antitoxin [Bryobacteraceae bacterium]
MSDFLEHEGYIGSVTFSAEDSVFHGKLEGIRDLVTYEATDVDTLKRSFQEAVEDYLQSCREKGTAPNTPFKGTFNVRVGTELHKRAVAFAADHKKKLNTVVTEALEHYLEEAHN